MIGDEKRKFGYRAWILSGIFGVISGIFLVFGYQLEKFDRIDLTDTNSLIILLCIIAVFALDAKHVWDGYNKTFQGQKFLGFLDLNKYRNIEKSEENSKKHFFIRWIALIIMTMPVLLAEYPGFFVYDAQDELNEVLTRAFSTHHPLLHVLLLGGTIALVHKITGSWNAGIFTYILIQMLVITAVFAYVTGYLRKRGSSKRATFIWLLYYGLFPTVVMYVLCSCKDGLFSAMLLLVTVFLMQMTEEEDAFFKCKKKVAVFIFVAVLMPCFRHNGFYAYLVFVPFGLFYFRKKIRTIIPVVLIAPVIAYMIISSVLGAVFSSEGTHHQEMLTVPIMQMARVYTYEKDSMSPEEIESLKAFLPEENLKLYSPRVSDMVKIGFNNEYYEKNSGEFWSLWFKLLTRHPITYVNAWFLTSYGFWYPAANINVYKGTTVYTFTYQDSSYFGYEVELPGSRQSMIPAIDKLYRYLSIGSFHDDAQVLYLFFSPGLLAILYMFLLFYRLSIRDYKRVLPFLPIILTWMTVLLGPTYLVRYVVYLWFCLPLLFAKTVNERKFD